MREIVTKGDIVGIFLIIVATIVSGIGCYKAIKSGFNDWNAVTLCLIAPVISWIGTALCWIL